MPAESELTRLGATDIRRLVQQREVSSLQVIEAHIGRTAKLNPEINAIVDLQADRARERAEAFDKRAVRSTRAYSEGILITIKSSIAVKGFRHECGTPLRRGRVALHDAPIVKWLKEGGATVLGSTNVPEFLLAYETDNALYGRTISPLNGEFTPGGSSGGDAAAVAAGFATAAFGSDAGGSVRVPAHFCGLYGFKPTPGAIPRSGHWPPVAGPSTTLAAIGPITRTAADLKDLFSSADQHDDGDISSLNPSLREEFKPIDIAMIRQQRIGWFDHAWGTPVTPATRAAVREAAKALGTRGFRMERVELKGLDEAPRVWRQQFMIGLKALIETSVPSGYRLHPLAYDLLATDEEEAACGFRDLLAGWVLQDQMRARLIDQMKRYPLLLCPVAAIPAFRHGERAWSIDGEKVGYPDAFVYSQVFNLLGVPAATAPVGKSPEGLPIGVQIVGRPHADYIVLDAVLELEAALRGE